MAAKVIHRGIHMLSTAENVLSQWAVVTVMALVMLAYIALFIYVVRKSNRDFPLKSDINRLAGEVSDLSGENAALRERFSRFQKREDLTRARTEKKSQADLQAEAMALLQGICFEATAPGTSSKAELYKRARNH